MILSKKPLVSFILLGLVLCQAHSQENLLADPSFDASEPSTAENPSWELEISETPGTAAQYQDAPWASNPAGAAGVGLWLKAFSGSDADAESGATATLTQSVSATPDFTYELSTFLRVETNYTSASTLLALDFLNASGETLESQVLELNGQHPADGTWVPFKVKGKAPAGTTQAQARAEMINGVNSNANPQSAMFDDFSLTVIEETGVAVVIGSSLEGDIFSIDVEDVEGSSVVPSSVMLTIDGASAPVTGSKAGSISTFTHDPGAPWEPGARLPWVFQAEDNNGTEILGEGTIRVPGSLIYGGGLVTTEQVLPGGETRDPVAAREGLAAADPIASITVTTPYIHFEDGAGPPILAELSKPYPLFDPELGGDASLANADDFAILSTGEFYLREAGTIPFAVNSDDGFELRINGTLIGDAGNRGRQNSSFMTIDLDVGLHSFELLHWEAAGAAGVSLYIGKLTVLEGDNAPLMSANNYELLSGYDVHEVVTEDTDSDGMDDFRETFFFGNLGRDGTLDFDSDGLNDLAELTARANPTLVDTDGDGLNDGPEVNQHGSSPALTDTDGDGLDDAREVNDLMTDPALADTDTDGFADNIEVLLSTDPLLMESFPDSTVATSNGAWSDSETWMDGLAPLSGKHYIVLGAVTPVIESSSGTFAGDSLDLVGPDLTLRLAHAGASNATLGLTDADVVLASSNRLEGILTISGTVGLEVGADTTFELASQLRGEGQLLVEGTDPDLVSSEVVLSGAGSNFSGDLRFNKVNARGATAGSLGTGTITIANGTLTFGYPLSSPATILQLQGTSFGVVLDEDIAVGNLIGLNDEGEVAFSLLDLPNVGGGPFSAQDLLDLFQLNEGISGSGTLTLLRDTGDLDGDGLRDSWEMENFGNTSALPGDDPDEDGLTNLAEQAATSNPNEMDTDGDTLADGLEVNTYQTDPTRKDSDDDAVEDAEEIARNLNPINADTDGDGLEDGFEITESMTDPSLADSDGDGFSDKAELDNAADPLDPTSQPNQFVVRTIASDGGEVNSLAAASALRDGASPGIETVGLYDTLNFTDTLDIPGLIPGDVLFEGEVTDHFIVHAVGKFVLPTAGSWGIGFHSDDGGQLIVDGTEIIEFDGTRGRNSTMRTLDLDEGEHTLEVLMFERIGGAALEVYRSSEPGDWGDVGNGALPANFAPMLIAFERGTIEEAPMAINSITKTSEGVELGFESVEPISIDYSEDLVTWEVITESTQSPYLDTDPARQARSQGFYRLR